MDAQIELQPLIIRNLGILEQAPSIADDIDTKLFSSIDNKVKHWVECRDGWDGIFDSNNAELTIRDRRWNVSADNLFDAYYMFSMEGAAYINYRNYASTMVGAVKERYGIFFGMNRGAISGLKALTGRKQTTKWITFLAERYAQSSLRGHGFELSGEQLFLPIRLDAEKLANAYPDALDDALTPIDEALDKVEAAHPEILALVQAAMTHAF